MDVFVSYSRRNLAFVQQLSAALEAHGKQVWFDQKKEPLEGLPPASRWWDEIKHGIETANNFLFIMSPQSIASPYCNAEVAYALQHDTRLVTVLYRGTASDAATIQAIDAAIEAIPDDSELPPSVSATITNVRQLTRRNWLEIGQIQYVAFSDDGGFDQALEALIRGLDLDLAWIRTWSQVRQAARVWADTGDDSYLWSEMRITPVRAEVERRGQEMTDIEREFLKPETQRLLEELQDIDAPHTRRSAIGERLSAIGDSRPGVGLRPDGLPDIVWCAVPGGTVTLENNAGTFEVAPFFIAKYPTTYAQFQVFLMDPGGFASDEWWQDLATAYRKQNMAEQRNRFDGYPRDSVSWYQAVAFGRWLSTMLPDDAWPEERHTIDSTPSEHTDWSIRLPTEWEWQQAATGGNPTNIYPWGPEWDSYRTNTNEAGIGRATAVGMYPPGAAVCGALDMAGNVWEWCLNEYDDPFQFRLYGDKWRALRGGSFGLSQDRARCGYRLRHFPYLRNTDNSFRVVCGRTAIRPSWIRPAMSI